MKSKAILTNYFKAIADVAGQGDAREESFYSCLEMLLQQFAVSSGRSDAHVTTLPKKTEAGNPDFRVWNGQDRIIGYIEAKKPTEENLDHVEASEQLKRYRRTFPNLILTNFFEFRLYRNGQLVDRVLAARPFVLHQLGAVPPVEKADDLFNLLEQFFAFSLPRSYTAESLAVELAKRTRFLRDVVADELREEKGKEQGILLGFYEAFQRYLIAKLTLEDFADLYAQTITYGLFAARTRAHDGFNRRMAFDNIPRTIGILRDVFQFISLGDLPQQLEWIVDDISEVLAVADAGGILDRFYHEGKGSDPIVHFYETFLAEYDPEERERRGVYYTPEPVVDYIVRSLHWLLKARFSRSDGLASEGVTLLDPAAGTMTFVARACKEAVREFADKYGTGGREEFIRQHILKNYYAFELMMAPYAVGHLKMSFFLEELGHRLSDDERFQFYLTNTLEMEELEQTHLPGMASLAQESRLAGEVKRQRPILVILGNPPYSGHSANRGNWIRGLIEDYKQVDGKPLGEKNPKWLQDDYVKFLRFAQWKIEQTGQGLVGMITNHGYLDNPTFRGMRQKLMQTFDEIYVLDLHGNSLKREICPDGSKDENVFDIRQGVAIAFFLKTSPPIPLSASGEGEGRRPRGKVYHADLWGLRAKKYDWLLKHDVQTTDWQEVHPKAEFYLFVPRDGVALERYKDFISVTRIFPFTRIGMQTHRDRFVIDFDREVLKQRIQVLRDPNLPDRIVRVTFGLEDNRDWKLSEKRRLIQQDESWEKKFVPCLYRPFDTRWLFYHYHAIDYGREDLNSHFLKHENLGLVTTRQTREPFAALVVDKICGQHKIVAKYDGSYIFPLYLYPDTSKKDLFSALESGERKPNLNSKLVAALERQWGARFRPHPRPAAAPSPLEGRGLGGEVAPPAGKKLEGEVNRWRTPPHLWEKLKPLAREMRSHPTPAEDKLWQRLRKRQVLGFKFRRQHPIDRFIVDFYCSKARLVVEVEGLVHQYTQEEDAIRQEFLESLGFRVLRFTNDQVNDDLDGVVKQITAALLEEKRTFTPEDIFYYVYAVLYADTYREKYAEFLRIDFPRIPFTADFELFQALAALGKRLVDLHLLRSEELDPPVARFQGQGDNRVARTRSQGFRYEPQEERVYVNKSQYFAPVPLELWEYQIGGYQVLAKWLKDRRERRLTLEEIKTYCRVVTAIRRTIALQEEIDALYPEAEAKIVEIVNDA